jgi:hypothetical protein
MKEFIKEERGTLYFQYWCAFKGYNLVNKQNRWVYTKGEVWRLNHRLHTMCIEDIIKFVNLNYNQITIERCDD